MVNAPAAKPPRPPSRVRRKRSAGAEPLRPHGRSLADFGDLSVGEGRLLQCCRKGSVAVVANERPHEETELNRVRAAFVRFLVLGGDDQAVLHEQGVQLAGAWISGLLDLDGIATEHSIWLWNCRIEKIFARHAKLGILSLGGCALERELLGDGLRCRGILLRSGFYAAGEVRLLGASVDGNLECTGSRFENSGGIALSCDGTIVAGDVFLRDGFQAVGEVRLIGAVINGDLDCAGGNFDGGGGRALHCDRIEIAGGAYLRHNFCANGEVRLLGSKIGINLDCGGGRFINEKDKALSCDRALVGGNVYLNEDFEAQGEVRLIGAQIGGDLVCSYGKFVNPHGLALMCDGLRVQSAFFFRQLGAVEGGIHLSGAYAGALCDDFASWDASDDHLVLDGFTYLRLAGNAPTDAVTRVAWLNLQQSSHLTSDFKPQPWEQLIKVMREMGHPDEARAVAVEKQKHLRKAGHLPRGARLFHWLYGALVGYGYRPMRLLGVTATIWLICASAYWWAANPGFLGPAAHLVAPPPREGKTLVADYANFVPLIYSADVLLPVIDLGYKDEWQPVVSRDGQPLLAGQLLRFLYWFEIAFGWVAGLLLVGVLGNLIKKD